MLKKNIPFNVVERLNVKFNLYFCLPLPEEMWSLALTAFLNLLALREAGDSSWVSNSHLQLDYSRSRSNS